MTPGADATLTEIPVGDIDVQVGDAPLTLMPRSLCDMSLLVVGA